METYGLNQRKRKKYRTIPIFIAAAVVVFIFVVGIIVKVGGKEHDEISSAVTENTQLKQQIAQLEEENQILKAQNEELRGAVLAIPTAAPSPQASVAPDRGEEYTSPRNNNY